MTGNKKIVVIGGGTGLSTMLKGLKLYTRRITAVVTVADDGGSSGMLRNDLKMPPPGDIRNCIHALADTNPTLKELISYRFDGGALAGHSFGNLMLAALYGISSSFDEAVAKMNSLCGIEGVVLPVTNDNVSLEAELADGTVIAGESLIGSKHRGGAAIRKLRILPEKPKPAEGVIRAIAEADVIVLGPGSLYTSIIPNLLVEGVTEAIFASKAKKFYVCNVMTQPGETDGYDAAEHLDAIERHCARGIVDCVIANNMPVPADILEKYRADGADEVRTERKISTAKLDLSNLLWTEGELVRHDYIALGKRICALADGDI